MQLNFKHIAIWFNLWPVNALTYKFQFQFFFSNIYNIHHMNTDVKQWINQDGFLCKILKKFMWIICDINWQEKIHTIYVLWS